MRGNVHDFPDPVMGNANPYGIYDVATNQGWVSVGTDHDTAGFAPFKAGIAATKTRKGLKVHDELDISSYPTGIRISDTEMNDLPILRHEFHGEWNYTLQPVTTS